jgi:hypothetical protein
MPPSNRHRFCLGHLLAHRRHSFPARTRARTWRESLAPSAKVPSRVEDHRYPSTSAGSRTRGPPVTGTPSTGRPAGDAALLLDPLIEQPQGGQLPLPLAAADPPTRLTSAPPGFPVQQVVRVCLVPVFPALPQEGEEQSVIPLRTPLCPLRQPCKPRPRQEPASTGSIRNSGSVRIGCRGSMSAALSRSSMSTSAQPPLTDASLSRPTMPRSSPLSALHTNANRATLRYPPTHHHVSWPPPKLLDDAGLDLFAHPLQP